MILHNIINNISEQPKIENFLNFYHKKGWKNLSNRKFLQQIKFLTLALNEIGAKKGNKIGIYLQPSPFWLIYDFAIINNGAISVPIFPNISENNLQYQIEFSKIKYLICDDIAKISSLQKQYPKLKIITQNNKACAIQFTDLINKGKITNKENSKKYQNLISKISQNDVATIIFTSGSTGKPKGVELTHKNLYSQIIAAGQRFFLKNDYKAISFLPLAHVFERMIILFYLNSGVRIYFVNDPQQLPQHLKTINPDIFTTAPRLLEKIFNKIQNIISQKPFPINLLGKSAISYATSTQPSLLKPIYDLLFFQKFCQAFGNNIKMIISGGAALDDNLQNFFHKIGINIFVGYGTTETSPVIATNFPAKSKLHTVGLPFPDVKVKISPDGEILAKGPNIMKAYFKNPSATKEAINDGWYKTGDLGKIDQEGFIKIIGRKKDICKTSTGKYVNPVKIENQIINNIEFISYACVVAEGKKLLSAILFFDFENLIQYQQEYQLKNSNTEEIINNAKINNIINQRIKNINKTLNPWENIIKYHLASTPATIENGLITPSMKLKRSAVIAQFSTEINNIYEENL